MKTDNCCREPIDSAKVARAVQFALRPKMIYFNNNDKLLATLLEQGVINRKEVDDGIQVVRAIVLTTKAGDTIAVDEQGLVL